MANDKRQLSVQRAMEWAFINECAKLELTERRPIEERGQGFGMEHVLMERAKLGGVQIDGGKYKIQIDTHEDAEAIAAIVSNLSRDFGGQGMARRVFDLAKACQTPDWMQGAVPKIEPFGWNGDIGETAIAGHFNETYLVPHSRRSDVMVKRTRRIEVRFTPTRWVPSAFKIASVRDDYSAWWRAVREIRDNLIASRILRTIEITSEMPHPEPWAV